ncbi:MAG: primosomal protein N' [Alphaproteobacteria bacterium]|nr:primosomal protein N' [Alphaproteobacteria bacterium]
MSRPPQAPRVQVAVALPLRDTFTYLADAPDLALGHVVQVPFGRRRVTGYVVGPGDATVPAGRLKAVVRRLDPEPAFDEAQLGFFRWMAGYYLAGLGEVIATALPAGIKATVRRVLVPTDAGIQSLARPTLVEGPDVQLLRELVSRPGLTLSGYQRRLRDEVDPDEVRKASEALLRQGDAAWEERESGETRGRVAVVELVSEEAPLDVGGARMRSVLGRLVEAGGAVDLSVLVAEEGASARDAVSRLEERGLVRRTEREDRRAAALATLPEGPAQAPVLNAAQQAAVEALHAAGATEETRAAPFLLHGVTGSGKTEVYLQAAAAVLEAGRQVLVLVPEISLTPQLTGRFKARFGERVAVLHSGLSGGGRLREWRRIRSGEAAVAVGARSALFAPFSDLGLVVVDEEHDDSYKQDEGVRYHARDLAVVRAHLAACPVVLGSATPSAESWQNAREGRYHLLRLPERATARPVPSIELVDMRGRPPDQALSTELLTALERTLAAGGKAIVLYNRRGYAPVVECPGCGGHFECPSCGVGLVYHRGGGGRARLQCHHCGYHQPFRPDCAECGADLEILGHGTARIEERLAEAFPEAGIGRMDADTTTGKDGHHRVLSRFRTGEHRILVGTQMVAKGHDFPDVHLAAVVGVDHLLMMPDFRSAERVHALVTQVAGRAGRGDVPGRVIVQTRQPDHFVFRFLDPTDEGPRLDPDADPGAFPLDTDLDAFLLAETRQRRLLSHPPFSALVLLRLEGTDRETTRQVGVELAQALRTHTPAGTGVGVRGPIAAPMSRLVGRWRFQLVVRATHRAELRAWLRHHEALLLKPPGRGVRLRVDVDPRNLL